jgi:hypothetical protein
MGAPEVFDLTCLRYNAIAQTLVFESRDPGTGSIVAQSPSPQALRNLEQAHLVAPDPELAGLRSSSPALTTSISLLV